MKSHILLIEDNTEIRENTAEILELANYKVSTAENGKVGVAMALKEKPDLIICDIMMPVLDGYGVLHLINKNEALAAVPFIFLSAKSERGDFRKGMEMGADDYVSKPFTEIELLNAIEVRLNKVNGKQSLQKSAEGKISANDNFDNLHALEEMLAMQPENVYKKKQVVYNIGNHPQKLFYVIKGKVKTYISNEDGKDLTIGLYSNGDFLGYTAILEGNQYKETAETIDETVLCEIPIDQFEKLLYHNKETTKKVIQLLAKNIREKERQLLDIAYNSLRKRVANTLLTLQKKYNSGDEPNFSIQLSREDLANMAGTATESVIRTLSDFKSENLIALQGSRITILAKDKLQSLVN